MQRKSVRPSRAPASLPDLHPLKVARTAPAGRAFARELAPAEAVYVLKAYRVVLPWCRRMADPAAGFDTALPAALSSEVAAFPLPRDLRDALILLCRQLGRKHPDPHRIARACLAVADCAVARGARQTALLWSEAAAVSVPLNPRFAWLVGKLHRKWDNCRDAEYWLMRSFRAAVRIDDRYSQALALNSLGNLYLQTGNFALATDLLTRALKRARRNRLLPLEGEILHDLVVLAVVTGKYRDAERYGALAFERYRDNHPNLPKLACDLAYSWAEQGFFERAMSIYESLLPHYSTADDRLPSLAALVRCAGAIGAGEQFDRYWTDAWEAAQRLTNNAVLASALVDMGKGALSLSDWQRASDALGWAVETARESGEADVAVAAEAAIECIERHRRVDRTPRHRRENAEAERLAINLMVGLGAYHPTRE
jgi:tetratricopeptide (TPR) repeat protein